MLTSTLAFDVPVMPPVELPDIGHAWFGGEGGVGEVSELGRWFWAGVAICVLTFAVVIGLYLIKKLFRRTLGGVLAGGGGMKRIPDSRKKFVHRSGRFPRGGTGKKIR